MVEATRSKLKIPISYLITQLISQQLNSTIFNCMFPVNQKEIPRDSTPHRSQEKDGRTKGKLPLQKLIVFSFKNYQTIILILSAFHLYHFTIFVPF